MQKRKLNHVAEHKLAFRKPPGWEPNGDPGQCQAWSKQNARQCHNPPKTLGKWCRMHYKVGPPMGDKRAWRYGLYEDGLHEHEKEIWTHLKTGDLTDEIGFCRISLRRYCIAQVMWEQQRGHYNVQLHDDVEGLLGTAAASDFFELDHMEIKSGERVVGNAEEGYSTEPVKEIKVIRRKKDFAKEIKALVRTIRGLEETQASLMAEAGGEDYARRLVDDIRAFGAGVSNTMPGGLMFGGAPVGGEEELEESEEYQKRTL